MKKKIIIIVVAFAIFTTCFIFKVINSKAKESLNVGIKVVPTYIDDITDDAIWCATFNLIWNDLKNDLVKQDIKFEQENTYVDNLNKETFTENDISDEYYYKVYGKKTLSLKNEIEKNIKEKFNQTSDILDKFDWSEDALDNGNSDFERYIFYTMLYREFKFISKFEKLDKQLFNNKEANYFGIKDNKDSYKNEISVIYYNNSDDFAIKLLTTSHDEIIINKNPDGNNFKEIYENMLKKGNSYNGNKEFSSNDSFKMPYININVLKEYTELENQKFYDIDKNYLIIEKSLQTIKFELNETGGKIKSEAGMDIFKSTSLEHQDKPRDFNVNKDFAIFLKEEEKNIPYFAGKITDITKFQK